MRAFILRRVGLIEDGGVGSVLVGNPASAELVGMQGFLRRNGYPYTVLHAGDAEGRAPLQPRNEKLAVSQTLWRISQ